MKNNFLLSALVAFFITILSPLQASHLDGLWRSHRDNIVLRIEQDHDGFRAKRIDQGIWYRYELQNDNLFVDRSGNWYELADGDQLIWNEARSGRRIYFSKVNDDNDRWNTSDDWNDPWVQHGTNWNKDLRDDHGGYNSSIDHRDHLDGRWIDRFNGQEIEIRCFKDGYMIRDHRGGYDRYYPDRAGYHFKDRNGNEITILDRNAFRWENNNGRQDRVFTRVRENQNNRRNKQDSCG